MGVYITTSAAIALVIQSLNNVRLRMKTTTAAVSNIPSQSRAFDFTVDSSLDYLQSVVPETDIEAASLFPWLCRSALYSLTVGDSGLPASLMPAGLR